MESLSRLRKNTPGDVIGRSRDVRFTDVQVKRLFKKDMQAIQLKGTSSGGAYETLYQIVVELYPTEIKKNVWAEPNENHPSWVKCSCPYFLFHCEYALAKVGSAEIDYSNGKPPEIKNKKKIPFLCKHLYAVVPSFMAAAKKVSQAAAKVNRVPEEPVASKLIK